MFDSIRETIDYSVENNISFADMMINDEMEREGKSREEVRDLMRQNLNVMREAVEKGTTGDGVESVTGYTGHDAAKLRDYNENNHALSGHEMIDAVKGAVATNEVNAAMGIICATPTAGSSGTIPGVIFKLEKTHNITEDQMIDFLFTSALFGRVVANNASVAGATGNALISADLALAGVESQIPVDEVIGAMDRVGRNLPASLRETGLGGLAGTPTGEEIKRKIFGEADNMVKNK